jgi:glycogen synthase
MTRALHLCVIASLYDHRWQGGAERQLALQVAAFSALGHHVDVITLAEPGERERSYVEDSGAHVHRIPLRNLYFPFGGTRPSAARRAAWHALDVHNPMMAAAVGRKLQTLAPEVVITHKLQGLSAAIWQAAIKRDICTVHALHDHELICPATAMTRGERLCETPCLSCSCLSRTRRALSARPFAVIGPSHSIIERHHRFGWFGDVPRSAVIGNALPPGWPEAVARSAINDRPLRVGYIGRLEAAKGIDTLLDAAARLAPGKLELHLAGTGDTDYVDSLKRKHGSLTGVHWLGNVASSGFYPGIDLLVVPSRAHESFCNVVMEAASLGVPSIVADRGALPERIGNGRYGWCFTAGDDVALAGLLDSCATDPDRVARVGTAAIETRVEHQPETVAHRYVSQLETWLDEYRSALPA